MPPGDRESDRGTRGTWGRGVIQEKDGSFAISSSRQSRYIYLGNLFDQLTEGDLRNLFNDHKMPVESLKYYPESHFAIVTFDRQGDAANALQQLWGLELRGKRLRLFHGKRNRPSRHLFVGNLSNRCASADLQHEFRVFGDIESIRVMEQSHFSFIDFLNTKDAMTAMAALNGKLVAGQHLVVDFGRDDGSGDAAPAAGTPSRPRSPLRDRGRSDVERPTPKGSGESFQLRANDTSRHLGIFNIASTVSESDLRKVLSKKGRVESVLLFHNHRVAFATFNRRDEASQASQALDGRKFDKETLRIRYLPSSPTPALFVAVRQRDALDDVQHACEQRSPIEKVEHLSDGILVTLPNADEAVELFMWLRNHVDAPRSVHSNDCVFVKPSGAPAPGSASTRTLPPPSASSSDRERGYLADDARTRDRIDRRAPPPGMGRGPGGAMDAGTPGVRHPGPDQIDRSGGMGVSGGRNADRDRGRDMDEGTQRRGHGAPGMPASTAGPGRDSAIPTRHIWLGGPPMREIQEDRLKSEFSRFGRVESVNILRFKGCGFVDFEVVEDALRAFQELQGRPICGYPGIIISFGKGEKGDKKRMADDSTWAPHAPYQRPDSPHRPGGGTSGADGRPPHDDQGSFRASGPASGPPAGQLYRDRGMRDREPFDRDPSGSQGMRGPQTTSSGYSANDMRPPAKRQEVDRDRARGERVDDPSARRYGSVNGGATGAGVNQPPPPSGPPPASLMANTSDGVPGGGSGPYSTPDGPRPAYLNRGLNQAAGPPPVAVRDMDMGIGAGAGGRGGEGYEAVKAPPSSSTVPEGAKSFKVKLCKGATPVCTVMAHHLAGPTVGSSELPTELSVQWRTDLLVLGKHLPTASAPSLYFLVPCSDSEEKPYREFKEYLSSRNRAGVAKMQAWNVYVVPPNDFTANLLNVARRSDMVAAFVSMSSATQAPAPGGPPPPGLQPPRASGGWA